MTREEAIEQLRNLSKANFFSSTIMALDMAIEALKTVQKHEETFEWCHDCKEYDQENHCCHRWSKVILQTALDMEKEFGIVRCKDCIYYSNGECKSGTLPFSEYSDLANVWLTPRPNDYCSYGEREDGEV